MTDFGRILDEWDGMRSDHQNGSASNSSFEKMLEGYMPSSSDPGSPSRREDPQGPTRMRSGHPRAWPLDGRIDLHGMNSAEAESALRAFIDESLRTGRRKVLIVHGKGHHSKDEPVLKRLVRELLEVHPRAGMRGEAKARDGGSGATWVVLK
jgi:DNA-nicking Smr family endonuclease